MFSLADLEHVVWSTRRAYAVSSSRHNAAKVSILEQIPIGESRLLEVSATIYQYIIQLVISFLTPIFC